MHVLMGVYGSLTGHRSVNIAVLSALDICGHSPTRPSNLETPLLDWDVWEGGVKETIQDRNIFQPSPKP